MMKSTSGQNWGAKATGLASVFAMVAMTSATVQAATFAEAEVGGLMPLGDMASTPTVAQGAIFDITVAEAGLLGNFTAKPKVWAVYTDPVKGVVGKKATVKVLTKIDKVAGNAFIENEWTKKIKLYDTKAFKAAQKQNVDAETWLAAPGNQDNLDLVLHLTSKKDGIVDDPAGMGGLTLSAPEIVTATMSVGDDCRSPVVNEVTITGTWFGTKKPKVWREYRNDYGVIKQQNCKVLKADATYLNAKGKNIYMNTDTGASKVNVVIPTKDPKGVLTGSLVLDNGVGMAVVDQPVLP